MKNSIQIGKVLGIEIRLDYSWFVVFILVAWSLAGSYFPSQYQWSPAVCWLVGITTALIFFGSVLAHEMGHSVVALNKKIPVRSITLFIFGGIAQISKEPERPKDEFLIAIAGPAVSAALGLLFLALSSVARHSSEPISAMAGWLGTVNLSLAIFNMFPGFPLDGGRILRSIVWASTGSFKKATRVASVSGQALSYGFIFLGVMLFLKAQWVSGIWLAFIGWFLGNVARGYYRQISLEERLSGVQAGAVMTKEWPLLRPELDLQSAVSDYFLKEGRRCFPVSDNGHVEGIITLHNVKHISHERWATTTVGDVMIPFDRVKKISPDMDLFRLLRLMVDEDVNQVLVTDGEQFLGVISRDRLMNYIATKEELAA